MNLHDINMTGVLLFAWERLGSSPIWDATFSIILDIEAGQQHCAKGLGPDENEENYEN